VLDGVTAAPGTTPKRTPRPATRKLATPAKAKATKAPATPPRPPAAKPAPKPERAGLPVLPDRRKADPADYQGGQPFMIVKSVESPWEAGAVRLLACQSAADVRKPGALIDLAHSKTAKWLGKYVVLKAHSGKVAVWNLVPPAAK
jgi:hypothetical protein